MVDLDGSTTKFYELFISEEIAGVLKTWPMTPLFECSEDPLEFRGG